MTDTNNLTFLNFNRERVRETDRKTVRQVGRQTVSQSVRERERVSGRQTDREREKKRERDEMTELEGKGGRRITYLKYFCNNSTNCFLICFIKSRIDLSNSQINHSK